MFPESACTVSLLRLQLKILHPFSYNHSQIEMYHVLILIEAGMYVNSVVARWTHDHVLALPQLFSWNIM